jgi:2-C-methyl-D-erythritol 4-phosphate cytidylyltransferase/2-C-methyl-D-erythritol 2,4-cyclodiphosphate synthase
MSKSITVLIVAGGVGSRMGHDTPKQYMPIHGKPVIRYAIDKFLSIPEITSVHCVINEGHEAFYQQAVNNLDMPGFIIGGETRQQSVYRGLMAVSKLKPDYVLIHDAARPCFYAHDIHNIINSLQDGLALTLAQPVTESLQRDGAIVDRENLWILQTPQAFQFDKILDFHTRAAHDDITATDDTAIATHYGLPIEYIPCGRHNLKITTQDDLIMTQKLLHTPMETRIGNGFDVHAFDAISASSIRLCGIDIPFDKKLKGHSDADVGLHALTDAIFGAMADGDIGSHFPPSNEDFKNMDSHIFLDKSVDKLKAKGGQIIHIDITFMCEEPKIGKNREAIRHHLSNHLNLSTDRISVKATTTEKLGFTGRGEGIACQAIVTVQVPAHD